MPQEAANRDAVDFDPDTAQLTTSEISAFITRHALITVRKADFDVDTLVARWDSAPELANTRVGFLLHGLLDAVADGQELAVEHLDDAVDSLENLLTERSRDIRRRGYELRKVTGRLTRVISPMREVVGRLIRSDSGLVEERLLPYFQDVEDHVIQAVDGVDGAEDRIDVMQGDIGERDLGLPVTDLDRLKRETTVAYHLVAIYNLAVPLEIAHRVNVEGTGNVLDFCARCEQLSRLNYVSTAYVAGERHGVVYEHELSLGQGFKNHYESTKFQAELWVREMFDRVPTTIYRPAIVVGDSKTGETQKFDGPYYLLRTISVSASRNTPIAQFGASGAPFNVVPVDFVVDALASVSNEPSAVRIVRLLRRRS